MDVGPKVGDAASLWNFTPSPGAPACSLRHAPPTACTTLARCCIPAARAAAERRRVRAGWTKEEVVALKVALEKFGIGKWVQIVDSGVLPGKLIQQLNGQTQRLLGQQSIAGAARRARRNARSLLRCSVRADNSRLRGGSFHGPARGRGRGAQGQRGEARGGHHAQERPHHQHGRCAACRSVGAQRGLAGVWEAAEADARARCRHDEQGDDGPAAR